MRTAMLNCDICATAIGNAIAEMVRGKATEVELATASNLALTAKSLLSVKFGLAQIAYAFESDAASS